MRLCFLVLLGLGLAGGFHGHAATVDAEGRPVYSVGVLNDNYPYAFLPEGGGAVEGFGVELLAAMKRVTQLQTIDVLGDTPTIHAKFEAGELDMLCALAYSKERAERFAFSASYLELGQSVFVRPEFAHIRDLQDLRGLRLLVHAGSLGEQTLLAAGLGDSIVHVANGSEALRRMSEGDGDATLATLLTGASIIDRNGYELVRLPINFPDDAVTYCFAVQKAHGDLLATLNEGLAVLHRTGEFDLIYRKWFGRLEPRRFGPVEVLLAVCAGLLVAFLVAVAWAIHQRRLHEKLASAHEALVRSELHYQEVFDATPIPVVVIHVVADETGNRLQLTESNPAAWRLFAWSDHPGKVDLAGHAPAFAPLWAVTAAVKPNTSPVPAEIQIDRPGGPALHLRWSAVRENKRILLLLENVTTEVAAAVELRQAEHQLRQSQKLDALGTLTSGIAHDFNNILAGIFGNAELLRMECAGRPQALAFAGNILAGSRRARDLVRQILTFSRHGETEGRDVDLHQVAVETLNLIRAAVPKSVQLSYQGSAAAAPIWGDPTQIHQVLLNLLTNAAQAIGERPGTITLSLRDHVGRGALPPSKPDKRPPGTYHCIEVVDTGEGMPAEVVARVFEPFFTTKTKTRGTGLGLSVAHGIVQRHGGVIEIESTVGVGTRVRMWLPAVVPGKSGDNLDPGDLAPVATDAPEVLVIDDETGVGEALQRMLTRFGCRPTTMADPVAALALFAAQPDRFRAVLSDLSMPERSGLEVLRVILATRPQMPTMLMTGFWTNGSKEKARDLGVRILTEKPIGLTELHRFMTELLGGSGSPGSDGVAAKG